MNDVINDIEHHEIGKNMSYEWSQVKEKSIFIRKEPTINEKIDFIYRTLKAQQRNNRIKLSIKITIFLWILYVIFIYIPQMTQTKIDELKSNISSIISEQISSFAKPIIEDLTQDFMGDRNQIQN